MAMASQVEASVSVSPVEASVLAEASVSVLQVEA
jgi:hypothetical protein